MTELRSTDLRSQLQGLWLPLVTPFRNGELDEASLSRLVQHYIGGPVDGLILPAPPGGGMTLGMAELEPPRAGGRGGVFRRQPPLPGCPRPSGRRHPKP